MDKMLERENPGASEAEEKTTNPEEVTAEERKKMKGLLGKALQQLKK
jgi:hypothetical protein